MQRRKYEITQEILIIFQMVKMLVVVVIFYSACWLPFNFFWVFNLDWDKRINPYIFSVCHILVQFHSCVNPVIYVWMNSKVRWGCLHAIGVKCYPSLLLYFGSWFGTKDAGELRWLYRLMQCWFPLILRLKEVVHKFFLICAFVSEL